LTQVNSGAARRPDNLPMNESDRPPAAGSRDFLAPLFLGSYGENNDAFEKILVELLRDHVYWRRNFHPEDPPPISTLASSSPEYREFMARMRRELHHLTAALKRSVPFASPRYIGHMASDLLLPGLIAQMAALPYNPNNVVDEAAPVTVDLEIDAGLQLARMLGMPADESQRPCAFGHLTSGGSMANYEALWLQRAVRGFPFALKAALRACGESLAWGGQDLHALDDWELANLPADRIVALRAAWLERLGAEPDRARAAALAGALAAERVEALGMVEFAARHPQWRAPLVMAPVTAHYSWDKAMALLGLGSAQLVRVAAQGMRLDTGALDAALARAHRGRQPVLAVVGVLGTTEFGTVDPIHRILAARRAWQARGLSFGVHVDAAWGGYLSSIFRAEDNSLRSHEDVRADFRYFPSREVHDAFAALGEADSVTVDPHKLGYLPYGAGALVCRDSRVFEFVAHDAPYVFNARAAAGEWRAPFRALGRYILEGSKSGAAAAAVYVTHRTLPLDHRHFGRLQRESLLAAEYFFDRVQRLAAEIADVAHLALPCEPDSNLICLAINPVGNASLSRMNAFMQRLYGHLRVDRAQPVQMRQFFGSSTQVSADALGEAAARRLLAALHLDPAVLREGPGGDERAASHVVVLRHTLMNPWLLDEANGVNYIDLYCDYLAGLVRAEAAAGGRAIAAA
jgi:glutamate/tyrosine decarboxylase-like PLP-dependent enzyme